MRCIINNKNKEKKNNWKMPANEMEKFYFLKTFIDGKNISITPRFIAGTLKQAKFSIALACTEFLKCHF